ncbi:MAG: hypothetical protein JRI39_09865 [Deltaproteobacteria bacterium]|nr:hypothetical protein [Deltaproteobacteria bacterium]
MLRCEGKDRSTHYVIPHQFMPKRIVSLNPESIRSSTKYGRFKEAWDVLRSDEMEGVVTFS